MTETREIFLVRHGRSAHVQSGWLDLDGFNRWRDAYERAAIAEGEKAPPQLIELARSADRIVSSDAPRAVASARLLAEEFTVSPLFHELKLPPPALRGIRLPLIGWALAYGFRLLAGRSLASSVELARIAAAARWLDDLSLRAPRIIVVTHHSFRAALAKELRRAGWKVTRAGGSSHWRAWTCVRNDLPE